MLDVRTSDKNDLHLKTHMSRKTTKIIKESLKFLQGGRRPEVLKSTYSRNFVRVGGLKKVFLIINNVRKMSF